MTRITRWTAIFAAVMGVFMVLTWVGIALSGELVRMLARPWETWMLLAAEAATAGCLLAGGIGILLGRRWGGTLNLFSLGMLLYCAVFSVGVFGQAGNGPAVVFFALIAATSLMFAAAAIRAAIQLPARRPESAWAASQDAVS